MSEILQFLSMASQQSLPTNELCILKILDTYECFRECIISLLAPENYNMEVENVTEEENDTIQAAVLEDFEVFDTRDMINVVTYSTMSLGRVLPNSAQDPSKFS